MTRNRLWFEDVIVSVCRIAGQDKSTGGPNAYLNWLVFDRDYVLIDSGYVRLSDTPREHGQNVAHEPGRKREEYAKLMGEAKLDKDYKWTMYVTRASGSTRVSINSQKFEIDPPGGKRQLTPGTNQVNFQVDPDYSDTDLIRSAQMLNLETNPPTGFAWIYFEGIGPKLRITHYRSGLLGLKVHTRITKMIK